MLPSPRDYPSALAWLLANGEEIAQLVDFLRLLPDLQVRLESGGANPAPAKIITSEANLVLALPLRFAQTQLPVDAFTGTASNPPTQAEVLALIASHQALQTAHNALLTQLRAQNPS
jgi:hypothetical protein